jgi:hypothetical protein
MKVEAKWNRCVVFTCKDGTQVTVKVAGEKAQAALDAKKLVAEFAPVSTKESA